MTAAAVRAWAGLVFEIAVTVTFGGLGMEVGAVKRPRSEIVPTVELPPVIPLTCHVKEEFTSLPAMTISKGCCWPTETLAVGGVMAMPALL